MLIRTVLTIIRLNKINVTNTSAGSGSIVVPGVNRQIHGASWSDEAID